MVKKAGEGNVQVQDLTVLTTPGAPKLKTQEKTKLEVGLGSSAIAGQLAGPETAEEQVPTVGRMSKKKGTTATSETSAPQVVGGQRLDPVFKAFMTVEHMSLDVERNGKTSTVTVDALCGKGHNCTMVTAVLLDDDGKPNLMIKGGNTRAAHSMRGRDYVLAGMIGGRWDKDIGADPAGIAKKIGIAETTEEVGAKVVKGGALTLGETLVPTMPSASTEADLPVGVIAKLEPGSHISGDGSGMELVGLMKPVVVSAEEALSLSRSGGVSEGARFESYSRRFLDKLGYIPELGSYIHDLPAQLQAMFAKNGTLGLGEAVDPRAMAKEGFESAGEVAHPPGAPPKAVANATQVNAVSFVENKSVSVPNLGGVMYDAKTDHAVVGQDGKAQLIGKTHPNQILHLDHDLAKVAIFYRDPLKGPMVRIDEIERPVMAAKQAVLGDEVAYKNENYDLVRKDLTEVKVSLPLDASMAPNDLLAKAKTVDIPQLAKKAVSASLVQQGLNAELGILGSPVFASPGQSDLQFHFFGARLSEPPADTSGFLPLSEALRLVRGGQGDAATEATLLRLADSEGWIPSLGISVERAKKLAKLD